MQKQTQLHDFFKVTGSSTISKRKTNLPPTSSPAKKCKRTPTKRAKFRRMNLSQEYMDISSQPSQPSQTTPVWQLATEAQKNLLSALQLQNPVELDLETIYSHNNFSFDYSDYDISPIPPETIDNIYAPPEKHGARLFYLLVSTLKIPHNCIYFSADELTCLRAILTLSSTSCTIVARLLKWKPGWHRVAKACTSLDVSSHDFAANELYDTKILERNVDEDKVNLILDLLPANELKAVAKSMKVPHTVTKAEIIVNLTKIANQKRSIFPGITTPADALKKVINNTLGACCRVSESTWLLLKKIITLHYPDASFEDSIVDIFQTLMNVHFELKKFPDIPGDRFPIFRNRENFIHYMEAKIMSYNAIEASANKNWEQVRHLGILAHEKLKTLINLKIPERDFNLPRHLMRYSATYVLSKLIFKSIEAFKKNKMTDIDYAKEFLETLINNRRYLVGFTGRCYAELALIETNYYKNLDASANLTIEALAGNLNAVEVAGMLERARKLSARKTGISAEKRNSMIELIKTRENEFVCCHNETIVTAKMINHEMTTTVKSTWKIDSGWGTNLFGNVEDVAMDFYDKNGYTNALHCEGRLPVTIFACLFWNEIYTLPVAGALVSDYQIAPMDLWGPGFYENRKQQIEDRINFVRLNDVETLSEIICSNYIDYVYYTSLIHTELFSKREDDLKEIVCCLGIEAVIGICETLIHSYRQMSAGFPDLIVWNPEERTCRIVEVKGPGDSLSIKQKLWINRLQELNVDTEVCLVKAK